MFTRTSAGSGAGSPSVTGFHDPDTGSIMYVAADDQTGQAALIDIVLDFDPAAAKTRTSSAEEVLAFVRDKGLTVAWILDTHPHADHLMASGWLKDQLGAPTAIGAKTREIAELWRGLYHMPDDVLDPDSAFDRLLEDGETIPLGSLDIKVMLTPGHTLGSVTYVIGDAAFVNDTFMHVDTGTSRADFPGGSSRTLYASLQRILDLPDQTRLFVGHDYPPVGARTDPAWEATVAEHRADNPHVGGGTDEATYVDLRDKRDATLSLPDRMLHALQVNLRGGRLPPAEADGNAYFKIPANRF